MQQMIGYGAELTEGETEALVQYLAETYSQEITPALDGEALLKGRCTECHSLSRVEQARKTEADWQKTVQRMVGTGAALNEEEQAAVIKYLAETYPQ